MKGYINKYLEWHLKSRFYYLLISISVFIVLPPFIFQLYFSTLISYILVSFIIISCIIVLFDDSKYSNYGLGILVVSLLLTWFSLSPFSDQHHVVNIIKQVLLATLFAVTAFKVIKTILSLERVNAQVLAGSVGAYLLFGLSGAMLFELVDLLFPNSFDFNFHYGGGYDMVYYSFVTLSTLGYGDITPHTPQGQAVAILVSITGQLYLAILMAMLVGKFLKDSDW